MQNGMPNPRINRATTYMPATACQHSHTTPFTQDVPLIESACTSDPTTMIQEPMKIDHRRPKVSLMYGTNGRAQMAPRLYAAEMIPRSAPLGWLKSKEISKGTKSIVRGPLQACHVGAIWTALIICESKPEVISMPIHVGNNNTYSLLRFRFRYHGVWSCSTMRVSTGSACLAAAAAPMGAITLLLWVLKYLVS